MHNPLKMFLNPDGDRTRNFLTTSETLTIAYPRPKRTVIATHDYWFDGLRLTCSLINCLNMSIMHKIQKISLSLFER